MEYWSQGGTKNFRLRPSFHGKLVPRTNFFGDQFSSDSTTFRLIKSSRGGNKLEENGFLFDKHKILGEITYWQCERRKECKARLHAQGIGIIKRINEHLHGPDMRKILCLETKAGIKRRAAQTQDSTHHIVGESVSNITDGTAAKLPKLNSLKRQFNAKEEKQISFQSNLKV